MSGLVRDKDGNVSSIRVMMVLAVITGCVVAVLGIALDRNGLEVAAVVTALLTPAFIGKAVQARAGS